jgi:hypothetical protein
VSDQDQRDALDDLEQRDEEGSDVEGHSLDQHDAMDQRDATEEPPDVEGHSFDAPAAMDAMDAMDQRDA